MAISGHGASVVFDGSAGFGLGQRTIGSFDISQTPIQTSHLLTTPGVHTYIPADLMEMSAMEVTMLWDGSDDAYNVLFDQNGFAKTSDCTVTYSSGSTLTGSICYENFSWGEITSNEVVEATIGLFWLAMPRVGS